MSCTDGTALAIASEYESVPVANEGDKDPDDDVSALSVDTDEGARVTDTVYVFDVTPSCANTTMFADTVSPLPTDKDHSLPDVTEPPFAVIVATVDVDVGVNFTVLTAFATDTAYDNVPVAKLGDRVAVLDNPDSVATAEAARLTTT